MGTGLGTGYIAPVEVRGQLAAAIFLLPPYGSWGWNQEQEDL